jgi:hypothetical protein
MATFGYTSIGASGVSGANPLGSKFVAPANGTITAIYAYINSDGPASDPLRCAVYADASGSPGAKLAESSEVAGALNNWNACALSLAITNGTTYWLMAWGNHGCQYDSPGDVSDQMAYMTGNSFPTWPDPFNENAFLDRKMSIYAEYTPAGASGQPATKRTGGIIHTGGASPLGSRRW